MVLAVLLESPQGSQSSSRVVACTCAFLPSCSSSVTLPFAWIKGSLAFLRGFPTGLSQMPQWCESILDLKFETVQGNRFPWNGLRHLGNSGNGGTTLEVLSPFLWRAPPLEMRRTPGILSRRLRERIPPLELGRGNGAPLDVGGTLVLPLEWRRV